MISFFRPVTLSFIELYLFTFLQWSSSGMSSNARENHTNLIVLKEIFEHLLHIQCPQGTEITGVELALSGASVSTVDTHMNMVSPARFPHQLLWGQLKMLFCSCCCAFLTSTSLAPPSSDTLQLFLFFQYFLGLFIVWEFIFFGMCCFRFWTRFIYCLFFGF